MNAVTRGVKNTFRNSIRTVGIIAILTVAIALSISMLVARDAVNTKISSVRATTGNTISVSPAGFFGFSGGGTALTTAEIDKISSIAHVTSVRSAFTQRLTSTDTSLTAPTPSGTLGNQFGGGFGGGGGGGGFGGGGTFTPPVRVVGTNSPGTALVGGANGGGTEKLTAGTAFAANSSADVAVIGTNLASTNSLQVGSSFTAWGKTITVVGIYSAQSTFADSEVLMPLATVQTLSGNPHSVDSATVYVDSVDNVSAVQTQIKAQLGTAADVTNVQQQAEEQLAPLNSVKTITTYTLIGTVIGAGIILLLSMLMIVRERRREIGVLKALGAPNASVIRQFIAEATTFTVLGSLFGFIAGILLANPITTTLVNNSSNAATTGGGRFGFGGGSFGGGGGGGGGGFHFGGFRSFGNALTSVHTSVGWSTLAFAFVIALLLAVIGSSVAVATIARVRPAEVLRSE